MVDGKVLEQEEAESYVIVPGPTGEAIPDSGAGFLESTLLVDAIPAGKTITRVIVALDITHRLPNELVVSLISPSSTSVTLINRVPFRGANLSGTVLSDDADTPIADGTGARTGTFKPSEPLSAFEGENPNGTWTLKVEDCIWVDAGTLNEWNLLIFYK